MCLIRVRAVEVEEVPPAARTARTARPTSRSSRTPRTSRVSTVIVQQPPPPSVSQISYASSIPLAIPPPGAEPSSTIRVDPVNPVPIIPRTVVTSPTFHEDDVNSARRWGSDNARTSVISNRSKEYYVGRSYDELDRSASTKRGHRRVVSVPVVVQSGGRESRRSIVGGSVSDVWKAANGRESWVSTGGSRRRAGTVGERIVVVEDGGVVREY